MRFATILFCIPLLLCEVSAQIECGPNGTWAMAGSSTVQPIADVWAAGYMKMCPGINVTVTGGGSTTGARQVCNASQPAVEIGNMSRQWRIGSEVNITNVGNKKYACNIGNQQRTVTQIDVAIDGLTVVAVNGGVAARCIRSLEGRGLKIDQLRWIYSNFTAQQLSSAGWDRNVIPHLDSTEFTHFFRELSDSEECKAGEIRLAAPGSLSGTFDFFREIVLTSATEGLATNRPTGVFTSENDEELISFLTASSNEELYGDAICFFGYSYFVAEGTFLYGVPIEARGSGSYFSPTFKNIETGLYQPFSRRIYMNVHDGSSDATGPFISYGLSQEGLQTIRALGFVPPPSEELPSILARIGREPSPTSPPSKRPTRAPSLSPVVPPDKDTACGILGLSLFCPITLCGLLGRLFGLCSQ